MSDPTDHVELRSAYADSVALLQVSRDVQAVPGVATAQVAMATPLNLEVLASMGFDVPSAATPNDMVVAVRTAPDGDLSAALAAVDAALAPRRPAAGGGAVESHRTTASALAEAPGLALVSVPGASAFVEAMDALDAGCDVMVFSDNVPVEQEVTLKRTAAERGRLVMGPDCGTAVVGGLGLGFANATRPGPVGIVAASGTGCQQLLALLDHAGVGVGTALGVGGRDLSAEVGGLSTTEALRRLDEDDAVELVVLVSKPPADEVATRIEEYAAGLGTPVQLALLGPGRPDLTVAAEAVLDRLGTTPPAWPVDGAAAAGRGGRLHGLFAGGTLCEESRLIAAEAGVPSAGSSFTDFGADDYTSGRAHPMIDPTLRLEHLRQVAADPGTGVVLLDVVLGHGADPDPAATLAPAITGLDVPVVVTVVGTGLDPQDRDRQVGALVAAGAEVHLSNATATRRAVELAGGAR
ncbi:FdrA family protein [Nocardioides euryhalodurans]|uniref:FdrA family protein n=1 Tax=Nocardioides euryhalodurans TaxID=2518370 RepID=A0A4P7GJK7_9ACTN|nr:FdrA family protein [Nocardioides euryhalodurans]QBR91924.1 FdrA family protein [Nocardioides euryhalodurans]